MLHSPAVSAVLPAACLPRSLALCAASSAVSVVAPSACLARSAASLVRPLTSSFVSSAFCCNAWRRLKRWADWQQV